MIWFELLRILHFYTIIRLCKKLFYLVALIIIITVKKANKITLDHSPILDNNIIK